MKYNAYGISNSVDAVCLGFHGCAEPDCCITQALTARLMMQSVDQAFICQGSLKRVRKGVCTGRDTGHNEWDYGEIEVRWL